MEYEGVAILGFNSGSSAEKAGMLKGDVIIEYGGVCDITLDKLTSLKAVTQPEGAGTRVVFVRDGREHSVNLPPGPLGISAVDRTVQDSANSRMARIEIEGVVRTTGKIYLILAVLGVIWALGRLGAPTPHPGPVGAPAALQSLFPTALWCVIYFGLRARREWVITLVLTISAFSILGCIAHIFHPAQEIRALLGKPVTILYLSFFVYQIHFFRKADVRHRFGDKGVLVV